MPFLLFQDLLLRCSKAVLAALLFCIFFSDFFPDYFKEMLFAQSIQTWNSRFLCPFYLHFFFWHKENVPDTEEEKFLFFIYYLLSKRNEVFFWVENKILDTLQLYLLIGFSVAFAWNFWKRENCIAVAAAVHWIFKMELFKAIMLWNYAMQYKWEGLAFGFLE